MMNSNIVLLKSSEIDRASEILARAFNKDPNCIWTMKREPHHLSLEKDI